MKYVTYMGGVWKLTEKNFRKMEILVNAQKDFDIDKMGKFLGVHQDLNAMKIGADVNKEYADAEK